MKIISIPELQQELDAMRLNPSAATTPDNFSASVVFPTKEKGLQILKVEFKASMDREGDLVPAVSMSIGTKADLSPMRKFDPKIMKSISSLANNAESDMIMTSLFPEVIDFLTARLPAYAEIFSKVKLIRDPTGSRCRTFGVRFDDKIQQYIMIYYPPFLVQGALAEYVFNKHAFVSLKDAFVFFFVYILSHEMSHILRGESANAPSGMTPEQEKDFNLTNQAHDIFVNLLTTKIMGKSLSKVPVLPAVILTTQMRRTGTIAPAAIGQTLSDFGMKIYEMFIQTAGFPSSLVPPPHPLSSSAHIMSGDSTIVLNFPPSGTRELFKDRSNDFARFISELVFAVTNDPQEMTRTEWEDLPLTKNDIVYLSDGQVGVIKGEVAGAPGTYEVILLDPKTLDMKRLPHPDKPALLIGGKVRL